MTMATESERIARIEGAYEHLATKADVETVKTAVHEVRAELQTVRTEVQTVKTELRGEMQPTSPNCRRIYSPSDPNWTAR